MNQDRLNMINEYINNNVSPLLIDGITASNNIPNSVVLKANCEIELLSGHYEGIEFMPPQWYNDLMVKKDLRTNVLVIDGLTNIPINEQFKFVEILKYRKISTFELPKNCAIVITCDEVSKEKISPEIYSLVAHL